MIPAATPKMMYSVVLDIPLPSGHKTNLLDKFHEHFKFHYAQLFYCENYRNYYDTFQKKQLNESKLEKHVPKSIKAEGSRGEIMLPNGRKMDNYLPWKPRREICGRCLHGSKEAGNK